MGNESSNRNDGAPIDRDAQDAIPTQVPCPVCLGKGSVSRDVAATFEDLAREAAENEA